MNDNFTVQIENEEAKLYRFGGLHTNLGPFRTDEDMTRLFYKAMRIGAQQQLYEIHSVLGLKS